MKALLLSTCLVTCAGPALAADLTLKRVMLSAAGVGYFERAAPASPGGTLGLDVPLAQVDDVLRSLVVFDAQGGVGSIELPGRGAGGQADAALTLTTGAELLDQLRGEEITVTGAQSMTGRILGSAREAATLDADGRLQLKPPRTRVTLLTADGLRQFILEDATAIQPTDPTLRARLAAALDTARTQNTAATRHLTLRLGGDGKSQISVGYVTAAPLWKASYRVVLPAKAGDQARIQGWAVLENQSGTDWKDVDLTLHAGNPVTFHQAIYNSYYADRPEVPVQVLGNILPDADSRATEMAAKSAALNLRAGRRYAPARGFAMQSAMAAPAAAPPPPEMAPPPPDAIIPGPQEELATASVPTTAAETAIDTVFHIATRIDLPAGHTASVPIIDQTLPAEQLDLLPANSTRPITALRLTNTSPTSLPGGALTLYASEGPGSAIAFAGDGRLTGLASGETRLLAFAEDLRTTAHRGDFSESQTIQHVTASQCQLSITRRTRQKFTVDLTAPAHEPRLVLVEFPKTGGHFSLEHGQVEGQTETATAYRVPVHLKPGEVSHLTAFSDIESSNAQNVYTDGNGLDEATLTDLLVNGNLTPDAQAQLRGLLTLRKTELDREKASQTLKDRDTAIALDEDRIRNNLRVVTGSEDLHGKLLTALDVDETSLTQLRGDLAAAQMALDQAHAETRVAACKMQF